MARFDFNYGNIVKSYGDFVKYESIDRLVDTLINVFSTPRGTYPDDPEFGSILYKYCFDPADEVTVDNIREEVMDVVGEYGSNATINKLNVVYLSDNKGFIVEMTLQYLGKKKELTIQATDGKVINLLKL